jgi:hypothetical protein
MTIELLPIFVLLVVVAVDTWVYLDARRHEEQRTPVVFQAGTFVVDTPAMWFVACLVLWVIFFPLYMVSRG